MHEPPTFVSLASMTGPNIADAPEEVREKALKRTADMIGKLDEVRRSQNWPVEYLPIVLEIYGKQVAALIAEAAREELAKHTLRVPITMRSEDKTRAPMRVLPGQIIEMVTRPQYCAFRPEDIAIQGDRSRWRVHDIKVGHRSQFIGMHEPVPGTDFGPNGVCANLRLETVQTAMDFALLVEYVGPESEGEVFEATVVGTAVQR